MCVCVGQGFWTTVFSIIPKIWQVKSIICDTTEVFCQLPLSQDMKIKKYTLSFWLLCMYTTQNCLSSCTFSIACTFPYKYTERFKNASLNAIIVAKDVIAYQNWKTNLQLEESDRGKNKTKQKTIVKTNKWLWCRAVPMHRRWVFRAEEPSSHWNHSADHLSHKQGFCCYSTTGSTYILDNQIEEANWSS